MRKIICEYEDWDVAETDNGIIVHDNEENIDIPVTEVFRFKPGSYENRSLASLEAHVANELNITFDYCGELDDFSGFVFWKSDEKEGKEE